MALGLFILGTLLQLVFFGLQWSSIGVPPLTNSFQALSLWSLVVSLIFVIAEWRWRLGLMGAFIAPLASLTLFMGFRFAKLAPAAPPLPDSNAFYLISHVALAMAGYACFTLAFALSLAWLLQERQLKTRKLGELFYELPPLVELERMSTHCLRVGSILLALGLGGGFWWKSQILHEGISQDPKSLLGLAALAWFGGLVMLRKFKILVGKNATRAMLLGFVLLFFGFYLSNTVGGGHGF